jgi:glycosyltransferase involved in cell wall biosynthesis
MKVLHICSGNLYGGVETIQVTLARHSNSSDGVKHSFAVCFEGRLSSELANCGVPVHKLHAVRLRNPLSVWKVRAKLRKLLSESRPDAVICHSTWTQAIFGPVVKSMGIPLLFWLHGEPSGRHWLERWASLTRPEQVVCCSEFTANLLWKLYPEIPSKVVYAPVASTGAFRPSDQRIAARDEFETPLTATVIVQVGRMEARKGHRLHLEALSRLQDLPHWVCWFVGGPQRPHEQQYMNELRRLAARSGIANRVRFLGERADVSRILAAADVFCQPNTSPEPFGIVFVEALSVGLPVITTAMGGGSEIVDSSCGVLTAPGDVERLAAALRNLVTDSNLRFQMSDAAPDRARYLCDPSQQINRLSSVIENTVARRQAA